MKLPGPRVTARSRRLAKELVALRERKGLTRLEAAAILDLNKTTLYRIETGQQTPQGRNLRALLAMYGATEQDRSRALQLAQGDSSEGGWLHAYESHTTEEYAQYISFEGDASRLCSYTPQLIPGLLQTSDYARAVIAGSLLGAAPEEIERRVELRTQRQRQAALANVDLKAVVDEAALWRVIGGPAVMSAQLRALREPRAGVELRVLPFDAGAHPGLVGSFVYLQFDDEVGDLVYVEFIAGEVFREDPAEVDQFRQTFDHLWMLALTAPASAALIETMEKRFTKEGSGRGARARKQS